MSKSRPNIEADSHRSPLSLSGDILSCYVGDRAWRKPLVITASVEWHLGVSFESVNTFLAKNEPKTKITPQHPLLACPHEPRPSHADVILPMFDNSGLAPGDIIQIGELEAAPIMI
jgi:hypothetical protein